MLFLRNNLIGSRFMPTFAGPNKTPQGFIFVFVINLAFFISIYRTDRFVYCSVGKLPDYYPLWVQNQKLKPNSKLTKLLIGPSLLSLEESLKHQNTVLRAQPELASVPTNPNETKIAQLKAHWDSLDASEVESLESRRVRGLTKGLHWSTFDIDPAVAYLLIIVARQMAQILKPVNVVKGSFNPLIDPNKRNDELFARLTMPIFPAELYCFLLPRAAFDILCALFLSPGMKFIVCRQLPLKMTASHRIQFIAGKKSGAIGTLEQVQRESSLQYCILFAAMWEMLGLGRGFIQMHVDAAVNQQFTATHNKKAGYAVTHTPLMAGETYFDVDYLVQSSSSPEFTILASIWTNLLSVHEEVAQNKKTKSTKQRSSICKEFPVEVFKSCARSDIFWSVLGGLNSMHYDQWKPSEKHDKSHRDPYRHQALQIPIARLLDRGSPTKLITQDMRDFRASIIQESIVSHFEVPRSAVATWSNAHLESVYMRMYGIAGHTVSRRLAPYTLYNAHMLRPVVHSEAITELVSQGKHQCAFLPASLKIQAKESGFVLQNQPFYLSGAEVISMVNKILS